jgi:ribosomal subunit interface protein
MKISVQFEKMQTSEYMNEFVTKKLTKLLKKFDWIIAAQVFYKSEKDPKGKGKICKIELSHVGSKIFAISNEESFQAATDETIRDLEKQLEKRKNEMKPYV